MIVLADILQPLVDAAEWIISVFAEGATPIGGAGADGPARTWTPIATTGVP